MIIGRLLKLIAYLAVILMIGGLSLMYLYQPKVSGVVYLKNAPAKATIKTETKTGIAHIEGETLASVLYA